MRLLSRFVAIPVFFVALSSPSDAQCAKVALKSYGRTCSYFNQQASLGARYDASGCVLSLTLGKSTTCCNTFLSVQALFLSAGKIDPGLRHPLLVSGCLLSVVPDLIFVLPRSSGGVLRLPIPRVTRKLTIYSQGLNDYFTTIGRTHEFQTSQGLQIDIS